MPPPRLPHRLGLYPLPRPQLPRQGHHPPRRLFSSPSPAPPTPKPKDPSKPSSPTRPHTRLTRLSARLPPFLQRITTPLLSAPVSHITSFLLLHELTAIVPLVGLTATFHYMNWLPSWFAEGKWVGDGIEKFGRYFRRKGWISGEGEVELEAGEGDRKALMKEDNRGVRLVVETATAWAIVKALMPLRIVVSVWGAPWFARVAVMPVGRAVRSIFR